MANVVKLLNGGTLQVRTGVLAGIGPVGPRGPVGPQGMQGIQGPTGEQGPIGQILQIQAKALVSGVTSLTQNVETNVAFGTVAYDDLSVFASSTNFTFAEAGDYLIDGWVTYGAGSGSGIRTLKVVSATNGDIWKDSVYATALNHGIHCPYRVLSAGETLHITATSTDPTGLNITAGACVITRVGSGPKGDTGPQGPQGIAGPQGPTGPQGNDGDVNSGFATYGDIDGV